MIHCIGDSHAAIFSGCKEMIDIWSPHARTKNESNFFKAYRIGPSTATGLATKIPFINGILTFSPVDKINDKVMFCFGEIDIRAHIMKEHLEKNKDLDELIRNSIDEYFKTVLFYKKLGYNMMIWGPIASWNESKPYTGPGWPTYGTNLQRNHVTRLFNEYLERKCKDNDIPFITIFYDMLMEDGKTNPIFLDDWDECHIHLIPSSFDFVVKKFKNMGFI